MSYPPYGGQGGYPPAGGGYPQAGGYQPTGAPGGFGMPTPESASAAAYGSAPGGLPYAPQPGGLGFGGGQPMPGGQPGYPPPPQVAMPGAPSQPGYPPQPGYGAPGYGAPPAGYGQPPMGGGYPGQAPQPGGYPAQPPQAGGFPGQAPQPGYGSAPPAGPGYGSAPAPGYGSAPPPSGPGYGSAPPQSGPGYGSAPPQSGPGYGSSPGYQPPVSSSAPSSQPSGSYGGYGAPGSMTTHIREEGTLRPAPNFNPETDAQKLRKAMKGLGTDEKAIIDVLAYRTCDQRQQIKLMYKTCFGRDLIKDLKSELSSHFEDACVALLYTREEYDAYELRRAMRGAGTDEAALIEILCTRNNAHIKAVVAAYKTMYGKKLEDDIISETSGHFKKLLVSMTTGGRMENQRVDQQKAEQDARALYEAGQKRWGTDENTFNRILASQSYEQLRAVFDAYSRLINSDIEKAIIGEMSGNTEKSMLTIVRVVRNKAAYFADRLYHSMKGAGTDDRTLVRVVVTRCEVDMKQIKDEFSRRYGKTLEGFIRDDISGDYKRIMMAMVGAAP